MEVIQDRVEEGRGDFLVMVPMPATADGTPDWSLPADAAPAPLAPDPDLPVVPPRDRARRRTPGTTIALDQTVEQAQRRLERLLDRIRATDLPLTVVEGTSMEPVERPVNPGQKTMRMLSARSSALPSGTPARA